jgi:alkylhydroperoxidase family enzyme
MPPEEGAPPAGGCYVALVPEDRTGKPDGPARSNIARIHDLHGGMGRRFYDLFTELMHRPGPLSRARREMIATVVSSVNGCHY